MEKVDDQEEQDQKIGGDTSGLEKSLSDVNNAIKKTQSQLRDVAF